MATRRKRRIKKPPVNLRYFIVNPAGAVHEVTKDEATWRLSQQGYRAATKGEVAELFARGGNQTADDPICNSWNPKPEAIDLTDDVLGGMEMPEAA